jgi:hypothetical protein
VYLRSHELHKDTKTWACDQPVRECATGGSGLSSEYRTWEVTVPERIALADEKLMKLCCFRLLTPIILSVNNSDSFHPESLSSRLSRATDLPFDIFHLLSHRITSHSPLDVQSTPHLQQTWPTTTRKRISSPTCTPTPSLQLSIDYDF